jgi:hypothetical protein
VQAENSGDNPALEYMKEDEFLNGVQVTTNPVEGIVVVAVNWAIID